MTAAARDHYARERELHGRMNAVLAAARDDVEVLDIELDDVAKVVRVFIDRVPGSLSGGKPVDLELCTQVTKLVHDEQPSPGLEVSSPGIRRPLRLARHFVEAAGHPVKIRLDGNKRPVNAVVEGADGTDVVLLRRSSGEVERVPLARVVRCHLEPTEPVVVPKATTDRRKDRA
jgi:ribosome maturation factor RimP